MPDQEKAILAMSGQSSMTIPSTCQPKYMPRTTVSAAASLSCLGLAVNHHDYCLCKHQFPRGVKEDEDDCLGALAACNWKNKSHS